MPDHDLTAGALVVGEALVDLVAGPDGERALPGGSCANVAVALARLGRATVLATSYGADPLGDLLAQHLERSGVQVSPGSRDGALRTSTARARLRADGSAEYVFDVGWAPRLDDVLDASPLVVHTGSIAAQLAPGADTVESLIREARPSATISYDVNVRAALMGTPDEAARRAERLVAAADVVKASDEDLCWLYRTEDPAAVEEVAARWLALGPAVVVITRGGAGASGLTRHGRVDVPAPRTAVVDTIGAGDTFVAGLLDALWQLGLLGAAARARLHATEPDSWERVLRHAAAAAAVTVSRPGADPPTRAELGEA